MQEIDSFFSLEGSASYRLTSLYPAVLSLVRRKPGITEVCSFETAVKSEVADGCRNAGPINFFFLLIGFAGRSFSCI